MKSWPVVILLSTLGIAFSPSMSLAESSTKEDSEINELKPNSVFAEKIEKAKAENLEAKILAAKAWAETNLHEALTKRQLIDQLAKGELEVAAAHNAAKKAEAEAQTASAMADMSESILRERKAKTSLLVLEQTNSAYLFCKVAEAKTSRIESETKLAKVQLESNSKSQ